MGKKRDTLRRFFGRSNRGSGGQSPSSTNFLAIPGNDNRPSSAQGFLESTSSPTPPSLDLTPSPNIHKRPASVHEPISPSSTTPADATSPDAQRDASSSHIKTAWEKAMEKLEPDDRNEFNFNDPDKRNTIAEVLQAARDKRKECEDKKWKYKKRNGEVVVLRDLADRLLKNLSKIVKIGDFAAQHGPSVVSLAWGAFRFLLQAAISDMETMGHLLSNLEYISCALARCEICERIYNQSELTSAQNLMNLIPDLYTSMLTYLCRSRRYFGRNTSERSGKEEWAK